MTMKSVTLTAGTVLALTLAGPAWTADVAKDLAADAVQQKATAVVKEQAADTMKGVMPSKTGSDAAAAATDAAKGADPTKAVTDADPTKAVTDADPTKALTDAASKKAGGAMSGADALKAVPGGASGDMTDMVKDKATEMAKDKATDMVKDKAAGAMKEVVK